MKTFIHDTAVIGPNVHIEEGVYIGPNCIIGFPAEYREGFPKESGYGVRIMSGAKISGGITIDSGTIRDTLIDEDVFLMKGVYIGHDALIMKGATLSPHGCIGGHVVIGFGANLGMGVIVHPRKNVGAYSMIGMGAIVSKKTIVKPGHIYVGNPAKEIGVNKLGLERAGVTDDDLSVIINEFLNNESNS